MLRVTDGVGCKFREENKMRYLLFLLGLLFANVAQAIDCEKVPDCEELGYSKAEDSNCADNGYMFCPFDREYKKCVQYNCAKLGFTEDDKSSWCGKIVKCKGNQKFTACKALCEIGDVYYADGTCGYVQDYDNTKTPVGIVFYTYDEGRHGKVISLHHLTFDENFNFNPENPFGQKMIQASVKSPDTTLPLTPYPSHEAIIAVLKNNERSAYAGKENTQILWENSAALMVKDFYPLNVASSNPITGQGKWFLPSVGEFLMLWNPDTSQLIIKNNHTIQGVAPETDPIIRNQVDASLKVLKTRGVQVSLLLSPSNYYWTSTYRDDASHLLYAFAINTNTGHIGYDGMAAQKPIRVMLDF